LNLKVHYGVLLCPQLFASDSCPDQLLVYADDMNLPGDRVHTVKKNTQTLIDASEEVSLEVNAEKTNYMLLSRHHNAGKNHDIKIATDP
jgi:hypothetical protein